MLRQMWQLFFDGYTAALFAWAAYGWSKNYLIAALVVLVATALFRTQRLVSHVVWRRG